MLDRAFFLAVNIGGRPFNTFLQGEMDEVRFSDVARTADEIRAAACAQ